ncbi:MASE1 domain-containing protein [Stenotrophomonas sp. PD6]|uniref:MASE1 domain-containing protein n=1 Tax=Stenotrophomonas sp. PD6 TaxID=3368612 RepID=UPI003B9FCE08
MLLHWWKNGIQLKLRVRIYPDGLLIAVLYALAFWAARQVSVDQFHIGAGIRVAALLLCPPRLWPYLLIGEYAYFTHLRYPMIETHGLAWFVLGSAFLMPAVMLVISLHRKAMERTTDVWILSVAAAAAMVVTLLNVGMSQLLWPIPPSVPLPSRAARYLLGDFIGILTAVPFALLWMRRNTGTHWIASHRLPTVACLTAMLIPGILATQLPPEYVTAKTALHLSMTLPAILLTRLHGWWGAAVSLPVLSASIGFSITSTGLPASFDPDMYSTQQFFVVIEISLLALGSTISHYYHRYKQRDFDEEQSANLAKTSQMAGETDLRQRALDINRIGDGIDTYLSETADWLKRKGHHEIASNLIRTSSLYSRKFREQASMVYPTALEHVGLYLALQVGGISEAWSTTDRMAQPRLIGDPCRLTVALQLAAYRALTEAVALLLQQESGQIRVSSRCGRVGNREAILVVVALLDRQQVLSETTCALAIRRLTGRTLAYDGTVQCRRNRIRMVLMDATDAQRLVEDTSGLHATLSTVS